MTTRNNVALWGFVWADKPMKVHTLRRRASLRIVYFSTESIRLFEACDARVIEQCCLRAGDGCVPFNNLKAKIPRRQTA